MNDYVISWLGYLGLSRQTRITKVHFSSAKLVLSTTKSLIQLSIQRFMFIRETPLFISSLSKNTVLFTDLWVTQLMP